MTQSRIYLFDASALLAFIFDESGANFVRERLPGGVVSAANWSEFAQKVAQKKGDWAFTRAALLSLNLRIESVSIDDAELAAELWRAGNGLSLADRLCLATAKRLNAIVLTADTAWGSTEGIQQIR